jgi:hypothetical protein
VLLKDDLIYGINMSLYQTDRRTDRLCLIKIFESRLILILLINSDVKPTVCRLLAFEVNTLRTGDADLRFCITTVQDG